MAEPCAQVLLTDDVAAQRLVELLRAAGAQATTATPDLILADATHLTEARRAAPRAMLVAVHDGAPSGLPPSVTACDATLNMRDPPSTRFARIQDLVRAARARREHRAPLTRWDGEKLDALGAVVGGVAHDFNNLLMTILANAKLIERDLAPGSDLLRPLGHLTAAAHRAATLTDQLLAFAGRRHREPTCLDINDILREVEPALRAQLPPAPPSNSTWRPTCPASTPTGARWPRWCAT